MIRVGLCLGVALLCGLVAACSQGVVETSIPATPDLFAALTQLAGTAQALRTPTVGAGPEELSGAKETMQADPRITPQNASLLVLISSIRQERASSFVWMLESGGFLVDNGVIFYDVRFENLSARASTSRPQLVANADRTSSLIAWSSADNQVYVWDPIRMQAVFQLDAGRDSITSLALSSVQKQLVYCTYGKQLVVWSLENYRKLAEWGLPYWLEDLTFAPDGARIGGVDLAAFKIYILDAKTGQEEGRLSWDDVASPAVDGVYFSPDWQRVAWVARDAIQLMLVPSGKATALLNHEDAISAVAWSPDGRLLASAAAGTEAGEFKSLVYLWDAQSGQFLTVLEQDEAVIDLDFSPDGWRLAVLHGNGMLNVWATTP